MSVVWIMLLSSVAVFWGRVIYSILKWFKNHKNPETKKRSSINSALVFSGFLVLSIFPVWFAINRYNLFSADAVKHGFGLWGDITDSLLRTLRTFSLEESFSEFVSFGREALEKANAEVDDSISSFYGYHLSVLNVAAPLTGGAIIFEILISIFPKLKLVFYTKLCWRKKCYFSELNARSLALAKSLNRYYTKEFKYFKRHKPVIIFTDAYVDDENEKDYELFLEAKQLGAICLRDDIAHVRNRTFGKKQYFLIDENEFANLQTLVKLTAQKKPSCLIKLNQLLSKERSYLRKSEIYLFVQSDAYYKTEKQVMENLKAAAWSEDDVTIVPVNSFHNLVNNLFTDVPLYEPLVNKEKNKEDLTVTILGNGLIGTEAFLSAYWFGQMLVSDQNGNDKVADCKLNINVVSQDDDKTFWSKIDYINPEIKKTVNVKDAENDHGKLLEYKDGKPANHYCDVVYHQMDLKTGAFWSFDDTGIRELLNSDYFVVALGSDTDNISIAEKLRCFVGEKHLNEKSNSKTVIAYAVFDDDVCKLLGQNKLSGNIYMYPFGSLNQLFSYENIFMSKNSVIAEETGAAYSKVVFGNYINEHKKRRKNDSKNYNHWADLARAMHIKYKVFSLGWIKTSVFENEKDHAEAVKKLCAKYKLLASLQHSDGLTDDDQKLYYDMESKKELLAWLEHRRWTAFTRTMGYRHTAEMEENFRQTGEHKNMPLKLHPCLVETQRPEGDAGYKNSGDMLDKATAERKRCFAVLEKEIEYINDKVSKINRIIANINETKEIKKLPLIEKAGIKDSLELKKINQEIRKKNDSIKAELKNGVVKELDLVKLSKTDEDFKKYDYCKMEFSQLVHLGAFVKWANIEKKNKDAFSNLSLETLTNYVINKQVYGADYLVTADELKKALNRYAEDKKLSGEIEKVVEDYLKPKKDSAQHQAAGV